ncbi:24500_t:CDS:1, partial [Racocetra persica]
LTEPTEELTRRTQRDKELTHQEMTKLPTEGFTEPTNKEKKTYLPKNDKEGSLKDDKETKNLSPKNDKITHEEELSKDLNSPTKRQRTYPLKNDEEYRRMTKRQRTYHQKTTNHRRT